MYMHISVALCTWLPHSSAKYQSKHTDSPMIYSSIVLSVLGDNDDNDDHNDDASDDDAADV